MKIDSLSLTNVRNFANLSLPSLSDGINLVVAPNGSGKSNLLEAIYVMATGSSPRTSRITELIRWEQSFARISLTTADVSLATLIKRGEHTLLRNEKKSDLRAVRADLSVVYFHPPDLNLLSGSPSNRRRFIDQVLSQLDIEYLYSLAYYRRLLAQRNALLRSPSMTDETTLSSVEDQMVERAAQVVWMRTVGILFLNTLLATNNSRVDYAVSPKSLRKYVQEIMRELKQEITAGRLEYVDMVTDSRFGKYKETIREMLRESYKRVREKERVLGFSLLGPQRDDLIVRIADDLYIDGWKDVGRFGSRGEQRMAIVRLKLAEAALVEEIRESPPILLFDDVFSELDEHNTGLVTEVMQRQQSFLTSADDISQIDPMIVAHASRIEL